MSEKPETPPPSKTPVLHSHGTLLETLQAIERGEAGVGPFGREVAHETDDALMPAAVRSALPTPELHARRAKNNAALARAAWESLGVYNLVVPERRGSIDTLEELTFAPLTLYRGAVPWIQRPMPQLGTGIVDPATLRDMAYAQRVASTIKMPTLPPGVATTETLEAYCQGLADEVAEADTTNAYGLTFEEQNLLQLRLVAAYDLLTINTADSLVLYTEQERDEMMERVRISERALRALNAINRCRPDGRPPHLLTSTPADGWFFVTSDDLFSSHLVTRDPRRRIRSHGSVPRNNDGQLNLQRITPFSVLSEVQKLLNCHIDMLFPRAPAELGSKRQGNHNCNRCIGIGLLPIVMAFMDVRFLTLNPIRALCPYILNVARTQLWSAAAASLYYDVQIRQLEHNIDWAIQLDHLNESNVSLTSRLYVWSHQQFTHRVMLKHRAALHVMKEFVREKHGSETVDALIAKANAYGNALNGLGKDDTLAGQFEREVNDLVFERTTNNSTDDPSLSAGSRKRPRRDSFSSSVPGSPPPLPKRHKLDTDTLPAESAPDNNNNNNNIVPPAEAPAPAPAPAPEKPAPLVIVVPDAAKTEEKKTEKTEKKKKKKKKKTNKTTKETNLAFKWSD
jgi:hypothetical protein